LQKNETYRLKNLTGLICKNNELKRKASNFTLNPWLVFTRVRISYGNFVCMSDRHDPVPFQDQIR